MTCMTTTTIYLIRHAEAEGNLYRRIHGWYDSLITPRGRLQIKALERRFDGVQIDQVWASPLFRTMTTAGAIYRPRGLELHTHPGLREIGFGQWEDRTFGDTRHNAPEEMALFSRTDPAWQAPEGETFQMAAARFDAALRQIAVANAGRTIAVFAHGSVIRQFLALAQSIPESGWAALPFCDNTAVTLLTFDGTQFSVEYEGDSSHLSDEISTLRRQSWWRRQAAAEEVNLWFRPAALPRDVAVLSAAGLAIPEGEGRQLFSAAAKDQTVGLLLLDGSAYVPQGAGLIARLYLEPGYRGEYTALQLVGQAVSTFRSMGLDRLLLCPPDEVEPRLWDAAGFAPAPERPGLLELYIGYDQ